MPPPLKVLFVCLHGSAKSVIATEHFRRLARDVGTEVDVASAGVEPDESIPPHVIRGLWEDGFDIAGRVPERLVSDALRSANVVVSFGCEAEPDSESATVVRWDDVPPVSDGYAIARDAIVARLHALLADVASRQAGGKAAREAPH